MRRKPVLFLATVHREADYWARAWGFKRGEWYWVGHPHRVFGLLNVDRSVVFVCGSVALRERVVEYLETHGFDTFVDAHDLDTNHEPRTALDLLPQARPDREEW